MKKASFGIDGFYQQNRIFDLDDAIANRDDFLHAFFSLKAELFSLGYDLATSDINKIEDSEFVIYLDMPTVLPDIEARSKSYLLIFESEIIRPDNWDLEKHKYFSKIFTWHDEFVDGIKYFKMNFSHKFPEVIGGGGGNKRKLCALIAGNKKVSHPLELYSERVNAINWFEKNHVNDFDLYGVGWDHYRFSGVKLVRALNRIKPLTRWLAPKLRSYQGMVVRKKDVLENYRFAICYENGRDIPGYITEKIFDCFFAGCVPVYWGANNVREHIPGSCFIDRTQFSSYEDLYDFMVNMSGDQYSEYQRAIEKFLKSESADQFRSGTFARVVSRIVSNDR
ncbi:Glycosyltransferase family 10 (fucosyltransferase) C-term [Pseudomonas asplenii]|uniref:Glycosyltransferase family 10 (Fucosyltransferase) C-term n=1 Tax=Pseudomonas asplenii TaxID=53407 RepID=A0A1H1RHD1_9PSED|nr:glycosyltransferase family 10 [Pseudomonas asplenii]SDS35151.1 Glycosyltransferase family 10 (fucosyltransferase) C-term [Pseudomonas asplenii]